MKYANEWTYKVQSVLVVYILLKELLQIVNKENASDLASFQFGFFLSLYTPVFVSSTFEPF